MNTTRNNFANIKTTKNTTPPPKDSVGNKQHGFTIIEVALVLAIAGLIFLVVFLALPALQNSQKDTERKQDVARVVSALQAYESDHGGALPVNANYVVYPTNGSNTSIFGRYLGKFGSEITGVGLVEPTENRTPSSKMDDHNNPIIAIFSGCTCPDNVGSSSDAAVVVFLSNDTRYCADM